MTNALQDFLAGLESGQQSFADTMAFIDSHYLYQPRAFRNGPISNAAGENQGSCKILGLTLLEGLSLEQALLAFGEYYRDVLAVEDGSDHPNIRQLMKSGLEAVSFDQPPLIRK